MNKPAKVEVVFSVNGHYFKLDLTAADASDFHTAIKPWVAVATEIDPPRMDLGGFLLNRRREFAQEITGLAKLESHTEHKEGLYIAARHLDPRISRQKE